MQEKESKMVGRCELKIPWFGITVRHLESRRTVIPVTEFSFRSEPLLKTHIITRVYPADDIKEQELLLKKRSFGSKEITSDSVLLSSWAITVNATLLRPSSSFNGILKLPLMSSLFLKGQKIWAPSSEFVSSSIPSWQILTAHAQPFRGARDLAFCLKVPPDSLLVWASSEGSGETARMRRLAWTFAPRIGDKYQIRLTRSI